MTMRTYTEHIAPVSGSDSGGKRTALAFLALALVFLIAAAPSSESAHAITKIVIDAGHGGSDPGNLGTGRYKATEKDITLNVALEVGRRIQQACPNLEIVYTRTGDTFPTLKDRVKIANEAQADLFISVHCDAFTKSSAFGSSTFVMGMHKNEESLRTAMQENASIYLEDNYEENYAGFNPKDPDTYIAIALRNNVYIDHSLHLSKYIQDQFRDEIGRKDRGVRQAGYYVISYTTMPSVLVELGFLTNPTEEDFLNTKAGQHKMANGIAEAFVQYKGQIEGIEITLPPAEPAPEPEPNTPEVVTETVDDGQIVFMVQILSSSKALGAEDPALNGVQDVKEVKSRGLFKYLAGATGSFETAKENQAALRQLGFADAFVVAYKGKKQIGLAEAIRKTK